MLSSIARKNTKPRDLGAGDVANWDIKSASDVAHECLSQPPFGVFAPSAAQHAVISLEHRSRLRGAFRPMLSRLTGVHTDGAFRQAGIPIR
jgi:hypothetical protein